MRLQKLSALAAIVALCSCAGIAEDRKTYRNPLLPELDIADPHVLKVDGSFYLYGTTHGRGYDVFVSTNLVDWDNKGRAFEDPRGGAWAPDVFHNKRGDGKFYLYYTDTSTNSTRWDKHKQVGVAVSESPLGPFVDKAVLASGSIDAHLFQDDDGKFYLYYVEIDDGFKIFAQGMSDPVTPKGERVKVIHPTDQWEKMSGQVTEAPFILKRNGTYYLMYSGSGADSPFYAIGYATSKSPLGPFVKHSGNPIVQRDENVLGPGHHSVIEGPDKKLWMVYHQKRDEGINWPRFLAIDPLWFDAQGVIRAKATKGSDQPAP